MYSNVSLADIAAMTDRNGCNGWGNNGMFGMEWLFALLILPTMRGSSPAIFILTGRFRPLIRKDENK